MKFTEAVRCINARLRALRWVYSPMLIALIWFRALTIKISRRSGRLSVSRWAQSWTEKVYPVTPVVKADRVCCPCMVDRKLCSATFVNKHGLTTKNHVLATSQPLDRVWVNSVTKNGFEKANRYPLWRFWCKRIVASQKFRLERCLLETSLSSYVTLSPQR